MARGAILHGRMVGEAPHDLRWLAVDGRSLPLIAVRRIDFAPAAALAPADGPLRQITLRGGDRVTGVLVGLDGREATLTLRGFGRIAVPRHAFAAIGSLPGLRDLLYEDFETDSLQFAVPAGEPELTCPGGAANTRALVLDRPVRLVYMLAAPLEGARVQFRFRPTPERDSVSHECGVELKFAAAAGRDVLRIVLSDGDRQSNVAASGNHGLTVQSLPRREGWRRLTVVLRDERLSVLLDEHVLASGPAPSGGLSGLQLFCDPARAAGEASETSRGAHAAGSSRLLIDDVLVQESVPASPRRLRRRGRDMIELNGGDRLFGTVTAADSHSVELAGVFGTVRRRWPEVSRILLDSSEADAPPTSVAGLWARVSLHPPVDDLSSAEDVFELALQSVADGRIACRHEVLGEMRLPLSEVRRIEPRFLGTRVTLTPDAHHLGDETRADFPRPVPEGHTLSGEWTLEMVPPGRAFFTVDVADLEPSGPDAPLGSSFLRELRDGFLRTDVFVNGERLGSLNELLRWKPPLQDPRRLRLPIPDRLVQEGRNVWSIEQRPARRNPREFDDALLGPVAVEFDEGPGS
jgi:hypothetical protein